MQSFKELKVWQKSVDLTISIYSATNHFPKTEIYGLTSQIRRCAVSIPSNIAEGFNRQSTKEYIQFLQIALGSSAELETQLIIAHQLKYIHTDSFTILSLQLVGIRKMLVGLIKSLKRH